MDWVGNALTLLRDVAPNARDYQGGDDFNAAMDQHRERDRWLREVHYELDLLAAHCGG